MSMRSDADFITKYAIGRNLPDGSVGKALEEFSLPDGRLILVSAGKSAWNMAAAAYKALGDGIDAGYVVTKYGYSKGKIGGFEIYEAGHPVPDENGVSAAERILDATSDLKKEDRVLFLLSGGASALFESPAVSLGELRNITESLLKSGADINEINAVRKRLSKVKGGRFALHCAPAEVFAVIQSDVIGPPDMIASGPVSPDSSSTREALGIIDRYGITLSEEALGAVKEELPATIGNVTVTVSGSVKELAAAAAEAAQKLGYDTVILDDSVTCEAREAARMLASRALSGKGKKAYVIGGETVVNVKGNGRGGRNQELALAAAVFIEGRKNVAVFSVGSDGTDGPTDAAGGFADGSTAETIKKAGADASRMLDDNDSYNALKLSGGLIFTGPTGTNVNDFAVALTDQENDRNSGIEPDMQEGSFPL